MLDTYWRSTTPHLTTPEWRWIRHQPPGELPPPDHDAFERPCAELEKKYPMIFAVARGAWKIDNPDVCPDSLADEIEILQQERRDLKRRSDL